MREGNTVKNIDVYIKNALLYCNQCKERHEALLLLNGSVAALFVYL